MGCFLLTKTEKGPAVTGPYVDCSTFSGGSAHHGRAVLLRQNEQVLDCVLELLVTDGILVGQRIEDRLMSECGAHFADTAQNRFPHLRRQYLRIVLLLESSNRCHPCGAELAALAVCTCVGVVVPEQFDRPVFGGTDLRVIGFGHDVEICEICMPPCVVLFRSGRCDSGLESIGRICTTHGGLPPGCRVLDWLAKTM